MVQGYFISENDKRLLNRILDFAKKQGWDQLPEATRAQPDSNDQTTTQCYVARTPIGGIPGLLPGPVSEVRPGPRENQFITDAVEDEPGYAYCMVYRIVVDGTDAKHRLKPVPEHAVRVYNSSKTAVKENEWIHVTRDKFGNWWAGSSIGGETGFWSRVAYSDCSSGTVALVEVEPTPYGFWQDRPGGVFTGLGFHVNRSAFPEGGPLIADGTVSWTRPGAFNPDYNEREYLIDCPTGFTGNRRYIHDVVCCSSGQYQGQLRKLFYYVRLWNGQEVSPPCHDETYLSPCQTCPTNPDPCT